MATASISRALMAALRQNDAARFLALMNSVPCDKTHEKRAVKFLIEAIDRDKLDITRALINWGVNVNGEHGHYFVTPLVHCARKDRVQHALLLIQAGADLEKRDYFGWTPLHEAAQRSYDTAIVLLKAGADVESRGGKTEPPLIWAFRSIDAAPSLNINSVPVLYALIAWGASVRMERFLEQGVKGSLRTLTILLELGPTLPVEQMRDEAGHSGEWKEYVSKALEKAHTTPVYTQPIIIEMLEKALQDAELST